MSGAIYLLQGESLLAMSEQPYDSETLLQALLAQHPDLLAGDQLVGTEPRRWLLVSREASLPSSEDGGGRWSVDHLFVDQDAVPTIVEVKRSSDTRIRREVVGQMLDYAANAVVYWPVEKLRATFETGCEQAGSDPELRIAELLGQPEPDVDGFWGTVDTNLKAGKVRLVFVADVIPPELRRVIESLNVQMSPAEVVGVEVRQYVGGDGLRTLVPRAVGQTAEALQRKGHGSGPRRTDWSWELYRTELGIPEERIAIGQQLFDAVAAALAKRGLDWEPMFRKGYVVFQRPTGYNVIDIDLAWFRPPRFAVKLPKSPTELGLVNPYALEDIWYDDEREWGWPIVSLDGIPDVGPAIDLARPFQPASGPMINPADA